MSGPAERRHPRRFGLAFARAEPEFGRVANLSDAVFAIAMTLLVLTLDLGGLLDEPATFLRAQTSHLLVFGLAFALVANVWWQHLKLFAMLGSIETGMIVINLVLLGAVALVPYPTNLVGNHPTSRTAVLAFIALFVMLNFLAMLFMMRAQAVGAWDPPLNMRFYFWLVAQPILGMAILGVAALLALWSPVVSLVVLAVSIVFGPFATRFASAGESR